MSKISKNLIIILGILIIFSGVIFAATKILNHTKEKEEMTPNFTENMSTIDTNKIWVGTFNLVWNDFMNDVIGGNIEFEDGYSELVNQLNQQNFTVDELNENSYFKIHGEENLTLKQKIEEGIKQKFNETSSILDKCNFQQKEGYLLYAMLKKEFHYLEKFPTLKDDTFGNSEEKVKYFGLMPNMPQDASKNIEVLFYHSDKDFAVKLKTKEGEEVYLYRTDEKEKSLEQIYQEMVKKQSQYTGNRNWQENDILKIPFIKLNDEINYDELCGRYIKGTNWYIQQALQTIQFELNGDGGSVKSEALIEANKTSLVETARVFSFHNSFTLFLKEESKEKPYLALKVDNTDVLITSSK